MLAVLANVRRGKPVSSLLDRARRGRIGGVLIHGWNFSSAAQLRSIATKLQHAAAEGGQPPLLIAVDQEGGQVKTVSWIPPTLSPPEMGDLGSSETARRQGRKTGSALLDLGVNTDFAPVADVPASTPRSCTSRAAHGRSAHAKHRAWPMRSRSDWATAVRWRR